MSKLINFLPSVVTIVAGEALDAFNKAGLHGAYDLPIPETPGDWEFGMLHDTWGAEYAYSDGNRVCLITVGDGSTARAGYVWQSTTKRADGLHEHIYRRKDGK
jgi:hypothetical protein